MHHEFESCAEAEDRSSAEGLGNPCAWAGESLALEKSFNRSREIGILEPSPHKSPHNGDNDEMLAPDLSLYRRVVNRGGLEPPTR